MKTVSVSEFKTQLSSILKNVKSGEEVIIFDDKKKEKIAIIIPYPDYQKTHVRKLGLLEGKVKFKFHDDFKMTEEEFLNPLK